MTRRHVCAAVLLTAGWVNAPAAADDRNPPPWREDGWRVVSGVWDFTYDDNPAKPNRWYTYGDRFGSVLYDEDLNRATMSAGLEHRGDGTWNNPGDATEGIQIDLTNFVRTNPSKAIRIQMEFGGEGVPHTDQIYGEGDQAQQAQRVVRKVWDDHLYEDWVFNYNPKWEQFFISVPGHTAINQIVIDTQCVPSPSTGALGLAAWWLVSPRRRRR